MIYESLKFSTKYTQSKDLPTEVYMTTKGITFRLLLRDSKGNPDHNPPHLHIENISGKSVIIPDSGYNGINKCRVSLPRVWDRNKSDIKLSELTFYNCRVTLEFAKYIRDILNSDLKNKRKCFREFGKCWKEIHRVPSEIDVERIFQTFQSYEDNGTEHYYERDESEK